MEPFRFRISMVLLMNKKLIATLAGAALAGACFTAGAAIPEGQLTIWVHSDKGYNGISKVGEKFTAKTGVRVTVAHPDQVEVRFQQAAATGNGPDIFLWAHDRFGEWARSGLIAPVTPDNAEKGKFPEFAWDAMTIGGKIYGYPMSVEAIGLICNRKLVPEAPGNWEDFIPLDDSLRKQGARAIYWDYTTPYYSYPLISAQGGFAFRKGPDWDYDVTKTGIANDGAKAGLRFLVGLIRNRHMEYGADYGKWRRSSGAAGSAASWQAPGPSAATRRPGSTTPSTACRSLAERDQRRLSASWASPSTPRLPTRSFQRTSSRTTS